jgi:hypothetical protein
VSFPVGLWSCGLYMRGGVRLRGFPRGVFRSSGQTISEFTRPGYVFTVSLGVISFDLIAYANLLLYVVVFL